MQNKLLTIAIPTYNRAPYLDKLLKTLDRELRGLENLVEIIIADNASSDHTPDVVAAFLSQRPETLSLRNADNLGPDENFCRCFDLSRTRYFWIIGDDDLPRPGTIAAVVRILQEHAPDLVYLESEWSRSIEPSRSNEPVKEIEYVTMEQSDFARHVHVWFTFVSAMVVNRERFLQNYPKDAVRRYAGTSLVQLGWVLGMLKEGERFIHVRTRCILATAENSGGYGAITVFGKNFPNLVAAILGNGTELHRAIVLRNMVCYLPGLLWSARHGPSQRFHTEVTWKVLHERLRSHVFFWLFLTPIALLPKSLAWPAFRMSSVLARLLQKFDKARHGRQKAQHLSLQPE